MHICNPPCVCRRKKIIPLIIAGGFGSRLRSVVTDIPKVMVEINTKPFITYLLDRIVEMKFNEVIISTGYLANYIEEVIGDLYKDVLTIIYSREDEPLGTGGALKNAIELIDHKYILVMNGDSYTEFDPLSLFMAHKQNNADMTILVKAVEDTTRFGAINVDKRNNITEFTEKCSTKRRGLINTGVYIMDAAVLKRIPNKIPCSLEYDFLPIMIGKEMFSHETTGRFIDIGTPQSFAKAERFFNQLQESH